MDLDDPDDHSASETVPMHGAASEPDPHHELADPAGVAEFSAFYHEAVPRLVAFLAWQGAPLPVARDCVQDTEAG